ncbi:GNAT family N-acetyltransferase [Microvirga antarctica]|uniref:GNAT family N-acetyltransferase n=1 Tax=Microvirga antarctica TaxID=2819233 RepID=UPI001B30D2DC|nr:GNAT family N-acetyltransferase [Microvirga antarctica]
MMLRAARESDIPALARVAARSYRAAFSEILDDVAMGSRDTAFFEARFASCWQALVVAEDDGRSTGFLLVTDGHIDMLFMDPAAIGKGVGAKLLAHAEKNGARTLECFRDNKAARRFYERHGWQVARGYDRDFAGRTYAFVFYEKR